METIKHSFLAPFKAESASKTTVANVAVAYGLLGFLVCAVVRG